MFRFDLNVFWVMQVIVSFVEIVKNRPTPVLETKNLECLVDVRFRVLSGNSHGGNHELWRQS